MQIASFVCLMCITVEWVWQFLDLGLHTGQPPVVGTEYSNLFGNILFNFAVKGGNRSGHRLPPPPLSPTHRPPTSWQFVLTLPSWLNEKKEGVGVKETVTGSVWLSVLLFIGVCGGGREEDRVCCHKWQL